MIYSDNGVSITVSYPSDYLIDEVNNKIDNLVAIIYKNYPLFATDEQNFSVNVASIKFYDTDRQIISLTNLKHPIYINIAQNGKNFPYCAYYDETNNKWSNDGLVSSVTDSIVKCETNHLTDFTITNVDLNRHSKGLLIGIIAIIVGAAIVMFIVAYFVCKRKRSSVMMLIDEQKNTQLTKV